MMEKAYAKLNVNYTQINGGTSGEALRSITGMPTSMHYSNCRWDPMSEEDIWKMVTDGYKANSPMVGSCHNYKYNLVSMHAYAIIKPMELKDEAGNVVHKLIQMRNPWGRSTYDGPWSAGSDLWTDSFREQADLKNVSEGSFYMNIKDWKNSFGAAYVTHWNDDWKMHSIDGNPAEFTSTGRSSGWLTFKNDVEQDVVLECTQWSSRLFPPGCKNKYQPQRYIYLIYDENLRYFRTSPSRGNCNGGAINMPNLAAGTYNIRVVSWGGSDKGHDTIWKMRSFAEKQTAVMEQRSNPYK